MMQPGLLPTMLYASCKKLLMRWTSNSFLSTTCAPFFFRQMLKSGVISAMVTTHTESCAFLVGTIELCT